MSTALTTLDGLADGTDIALQRGGVTERWKFQDNKLVNKDGDNLDPFFFEGYLAEGRLYLGNFLPPEAGEWFGSAGVDRWMLLALNTEGAKTWCAQFQRGHFYQWIEYTDMVTTFQRIAAPEWSSEQFVNMTARAWSSHREVSAQEERNRKQRLAQESVTYAIDYLNRARGYLG